MFPAIKEIRSIGAVTRCTLDGWLWKALGAFSLQKCPQYPLPLPPFCRYTIHMESSDLVYIQRIIVACVRDNPGRLSRSGLAKLLVGSRALEMKKWEGNRWNNRLHGMSRKSVTVDVDILIQQGYLALDSHQMVVLGEIAKEHVVDNLKLTTT